MACKVEGADVLDVAWDLEYALTKNGPFVLIVGDEHGERKQIVSREGFLEFFICFAIERLYAIADVEE